MSTMTNQSQAPAAVAKFVRFLENGDATDVFADDVFADVSLPQWRLQAGTAKDLIAIRVEGHPSPGKVRISRLDPTDRGFVIEFEERWDQDGQHWYCREMARCDVENDLIVGFSVYCTGDWDESVQAEHARSVTLIRP